jgi:hypothetical protein
LTPQNPGRRGRFPARPEAACYRLFVQITQVRARGRP